MNQQTQIDILFSVIANLQEQNKELSEKVSLLENLNRFLNEKAENSSEVSTAPKEFSTTDFLKRQF